MGTVHGVWLKYVALSGLSFAGYSYFSESSEDEDRSSAFSLLGLTVTRSTLPALAWGYSTAVNGVIAILFKLEWGMSILGKDTVQGTIPWWSYVVWFPFHIPTYLYTNIHKFISRYKNPETDVYEPVPVAVATQVQTGWWIGGCHGPELHKDWSAVIDLTVEFPESCRTVAYLAIPTWDGVPASPAQLEHAAAWAVQQHDKYGGDILVHCAHGRGRSTTVLCACLVKAGLFETWQQAFEEGIKPKRPVCKLNKRMRENLTQWQELYVAKGK